ncbi:hypothetical protein [Bacillus weihaiensis]|uniref:Uncharacterized protein n=1 Tax=Bacillus weihaiensis TaxID=1547283 RepID=A0A1L3MU49_9BACI|nr:hypothetical protein [Bacillus weihaiensis]APH05861.1 hypothetical protein A9C19_14575 [Bacillus weihaiensis]
MKTKNNQKYEVFGTINLPISIEVECSNMEEAIYHAQVKLDELGIKAIKLQITTINEQLITPKVHDFEVQVERAFEL